jgi:glycine cleavage system T protein
MRTHARVVVIGGGVFGTSVAYHLAKAGCTDIVLVDKGELTSGTTFHSVGLVSQFRTSPSLMKIMNYTINLFNELQEEVGDTLGWHTVGSLRLASSPERLKGLMREVSRARAIGIRAEVIGPSEAMKIAPFMSDKDLYGAVYVPDDGHIDPSSITYELARQAKKMGAEICTNTRVTNIEVSPKGEVTKVVTDKGEIVTECVVNAAGEWSPRIGEMVGVHIPMVPLMHQYLTSKPIPGHELPRNTPVVRDPDNLFYCREDVGSFLIGGFEIDPMAWSVDGVSWDFNQQLLDGDWDLFESVMEGAIRRIPVLEQAETIELVNGPDAFTPDGHYALGPVPGLKGYYVAAGGSINGIAGAGGVGKVLTEWILDGAPSIDTHEMNVRRFGAHWQDTGYLTEHCREVYRYYYNMRFPGDENIWGRPLRTSAFYPKLQEQGAVFGEKNGWERVNYFDTGNKWRTAGSDQSAWGWGRPPHFDLVGREVKAAREAAVLIDMTSFGKIEVSGKGALKLLQHLSVSELDRPDGSITYTQFLNPKGGIESDVTVTRLSADRFRIISGTSFVANDLGWIRMHLPEDGSVQVKDVTEDLACVCLWGPSARSILETVTADDVSNSGFSYMQAKSIRIGDIPVWAQRVSYVGELGWEIYVDPDHAADVWDTLMKTGEKFDIRPIGYKALDAMRIEKGYLYWSGDITPEDNPFEAGLSFTVDLEKKDFIGREALLKIKSEGPKHRLCALTLDAGGNLYGGESVYDSNGQLVDRIRTGGHGHTVGKDIGLMYLPAELTHPGTELEVEVLGERVRAVVVKTPLIDPEGKNLKL